MSRAPAAPASKPVVKPLEAMSGGKGMGKRIYGGETSGVAQRFELELIDLRQVDKAGPSKRAEKKAKHSQRGQPSPARFVHAHLSADVVFV